MPHVHELDLGSGLTTFRAGDDEFRVDLVKEVRWYMEEGPKFEGMAALDAVRDRIAHCHKVWLNDSQADAYLHALNLAYLDLKKKQREELS